MSGARHVLMDRKKARHRGISNNLLAMLALVFMAISISSSIIVFMGTEPERPMVGFSTSQDSARVSITIAGNSPQVTIHEPEPCQVISGSFVINASVEDGNGNSTVTNVSFYYTYDGINWAYIGSEYYDGDGEYNISWNTGLIPDGIHYTVRVLAVDTTGLQGSEEVGFLAVNNLNTEPDWTSFKYNTSTNLSVLSSWDSVPNLRLGNQYGFMNFSGRTINVDGVNLSRYFSIASKMFVMDGSDIPCIEGGAYLHFLDANMIAPNIYRNGAPCPGGVCTLISNNLRDVVISVTDFGTYQLVNNANYDIWDLTDANRIPGGQTIYKNQQVDFFLNLSADNIPLTSPDIRCSIRFSNDTQAYWLMVFKNRSLYEYNRSFSAPGRYSWNVSCNSTDNDFFHIYDEDNVTIANRAPRLMKNLPNITMEEDTVAQYINDLNDYFMDMEGDEITFSVSSIPNVVTTVAHDTIIIRPERDWFGERTFVVYATDQFGLQNVSNMIYLKVIDMPEPPPPGAGGGGGGDSYDDSFVDMESPQCQDDWMCSVWSECMFRWAWNTTPNTNVLDTLVSLGEYDENEGIMSRSCSDRNHCNYWWKKPNGTQWCYYTPRCDDSIKNGNETGVDCGGSCASCFTCGDKIQNQGEEGVDCGGPCAPCGNCNDGRMNCHDSSCELGVDCGGPCTGVCPEVESPLPRINLLTLSLVSLLLLALFFTFYLFIRPYIVRIYLWLVAMREKKDVVPEATLLEIETNYLTLLEKLKRKAVRSGVAEVSDELNTLFRNFLREAFKVKTEATLEDLSELIKKTKLPGMLRIALAEYIKEIVQIGYSSTKVSKGEIISKIDQAKELLGLIVRNMPKEEMGAGAGKGKEAGKAVKTKTIANKARVEGPGLAGVYKLGIEAKRAIVKGDIEAAQKIRAEIGKMYKWLRKSERDILERTLAELDNDLQKMKKGDKD